MLRMKMSTMVLAAAALAAGVRAEPGLRLTPRLKEGKPQTMVTYGTSLTQGGAWVGQVESALKESFPGLGLHPGPEGCAAVITPAILEALGLDAAPQPSGPPAPEGAG